MANNVGEFARHWLDQVTAVDPGDRMRVELHAAPPSGGSLGHCDPDDDTVPVWISPGSVEFSFTVIDGVSPLLAAMLRSDLFTETCCPTALRDRGRESADLLGVCISPQPWALHGREKTSLELAIEQWNRDHPPTPLVPYVITSCQVYELMESDETTSVDSSDCSAGGGRWSDLMAQIDDLIEEE